MRVACAFSFTADDNFQDILFSRNHCAHAQAHTHTEKMESAKAKRSETAKPFAYLNRIERVN